MIFGGINMKDPIAIEYYKIVKFFELSKFDEHHQDTPFEGQTQESISQQADCFFKVAQSNFKFSSYGKEIIKCQRKGIQYLKEHLVEALLSDEMYIRLMAQLIYKDINKDNK